MSTTVPSMADLEALERRVAGLERKLLRSGPGEGWIPVAKSPLGGRKTARLIAAGKLPASRVGRKLYVRAEDLDAFLAARPVVPVKARPPGVTTAVDDATAYAEANVHLLTGQRRAS